MSMQLALASALNNLRANTAQTSVISKNIESAGVEHYVRKDMSTVTRFVAGVNLGIEVIISRNVDERLIRDVRQESSVVSSLDAKARALSGYIEVIGQPQDERSVASMVSNLRISLQTLLDGPGEQVVQRNAVKAADDLAATIKRMYAESRQVQSDADEQIRTKVDLVNSNLKRIEQLNKQITAGKAAGRDISDLQDERDRLTDQIAEQIGITTYQRGNGELVILARGGATLLDSNANTLVFTPFGSITTSDGTDLTLSPATGMTSGAIAGLMEVRDSIMTSFQNQLDQLASGLIRAFEAADGTIGAPPADTGLFTDAGLAFNPANIQGLGERIRVNPSVRPEDGGDLWRISAGMHATDPVPGGDTTQVMAFLNAFDTVQAYDPASGLPTSATLQSYATSLVTLQQTVRTEIESQNDARMVTYENLRQTRLNRDGVNIDDELQKMFFIQQSYAASATMLTSVKELMDILTSI